jgi:hypothetical protein
LTPQTSKKDRLINETDCLGLFVWLVLLLSATKHLKSISRLLIDSTDI